MATIVLVHGAWQSGRTWDGVRGLIEERGHEVIVPVLSGLGQDAGSLGPEISLRQHVDDVCRAMITRGAQEVILVGHSYGGVVIEGVAEKLPERIGRLYFVDSLLLEDGESLLGALPPEMAGRLRQIAEDEGEGWRLPAREELLDVWGVPKGAARDFVRERFCDFTIRCFEEPIELPLRAMAEIECSYLACTADYPGRSVAAEHFARARELGWTVEELPTGHACHVEQPREFVDLLLRRAVPSAHLLV